MNILEVTSTVSGGLLLNGNRAARAAGKGLSAVLVCQAVKVHLLGVRFRGILLGHHAVDVQQRASATRRGHGYASSPGGWLEGGDGCFDRLRHDREKACVKSRREDWDPNYFTIGLLWHACLFQASSTP